MHSSWFGIQFLEDKDDADNAETEVQSPNGTSSSSPPSLSNIWLRSAIINTASYRCVGPTKYSLDYS